MYGINPSRSALADAERVAKAYVTNRGQMKRADRRLLYRVLKRGVPTGFFAGRIPFPVLERVYNEESKSSYGVY